MSSLRNHTLEETAEILGCYVGYLRDNLHRFQHQKIGKAEPVFDDEEILKIKELHRVYPAEDQSTPRQQPAPSPSRPAQPVSPTLSSLRPSQRNRRRSAS